jgi:hypothetical protein
MTWHLAYSQQLVTLLELLLGSRVILIKPISCPQRKSCIVFWSKSLSSNEHEQNNIHYSTVVGNLESWSTSQTVLAPTLYNAFPVVPGFPPARGVLLHDTCWIVFVVRNQVALQLVYALACRLVLVLAVGFLFHYGKETNIIYIEVFMLDPSF